MKNSFKIILLLLGVMIYAGCKKMEMDVAGYSALPVMPSPGYEYDPTVNKEKAALGRVLFYDKKMSLNNSVSCATCHQQSKAFCDNKQFTPGLQDVLTKRNTPTILVHDNSLFWDGRASNFVDLALMPLENHVEMKNYDISQLEKKIAETDYYQTLFIDAFGTNEVKIDRIQIALAEFMNAFRFFNNKNERIMMGFESPNAEEKLGKELFFGKAKCGSCHSARPPFAGWGGGGPGVGHQECIGLDENYADNGLGEFTGNADGNGMFRVPTLLNIQYTAPYMHDGRFKTLEEVIEHYNSGVKAHPNLSWALTEFPDFDNMSTLELHNLFDTNGDGNITGDEIPPGPPIHLNLNQMEKNALVAFLKTLSDPSVFTDVKFSDPFRVN